MPRHNAELPPNSVVLHTVNCVPDRPCPCSGHCDVHARVCVFPPWAITECVTPSFQLTRRNLTWRKPVLGESVLYRWGEVAKVTALLPPGHLELQSPERGQFCPGGLCKERVEDVKATTECVGPNGELACAIIPSMAVNGTAWARHMELEYLGQSALAAPYRPRVRAAWPFPQYGEWHGCFGSSEGCRTGQRGACCSGRGRCVQGWCLCHAGASGLDCAHRARPRQQQQQQQWPRQPTQARAHAHAHAHAQARPRQPTQARV